MYIACMYMYIITLFQPQCTDFAPTLAPAASLLRQGVERWGGGRHVFSSLKPASRAQRRLDNAPPVPDTQTRPSLPSSSFAAHLSPTENVQTLEKKKLKPSAGSCRVQLVTRDRALSEGPFLFRTCGTTCPEWIWEILCACGSCCRL